MPSKLHEALLLLFRSCPALLVWLLKTRLKKKVPSYHRLGLYDQNLTPDTSKPHFGDVVVTLENKKKRTIYAIIGESQLGIDLRKHKSWPVYAATLHRELNCQIAVLVISPKAFVAKWAKKPIKTLQEGSSFVPLVIGPDLVPRVLSATTT